MSGSTHRHRSYMQDAMRHGSMLSESVARVKSRFSTCRFIGEVINGYKQLGIVMRDSGKLFCGERGAGDLHWHEVKEPEGVRMQNATRNHEAVLNLLHVNHCNPYG